MRNFDGKTKKTHEKEGLGFPEFSGTYFRELIYRPEFREGLKIVLVLDLENGNGKIKVFSLDGRDQSRSRSRTSIVSRPTFEKPSRLSFMSRSTFFYLGRDFLN